MSKATNEMREIANEMQRNFDDDIWNKYKALTETYKKVLADGQKLANEVIRLDAENSRLKEENGQLKKELELPTGRYITGPRCVLVPCVDGPLRGPIDVKPGCLGCAQVIGDIRESVRKQTISDLREKLKEKVFDTATVGHIVSVIRIPEPGRSFKDADLQELGLL